MLTVIFATFAVGVIVAPLLFGRLSDEIGRRRVLLAGLGLSALSALAFLLTVDKVAFLQRTPAWCQARAAEIGPGCSQVIAELLSVNALYRLRSAQAVVGLADKHTAGRTEAACGLAIEVGDPSYRTIKVILNAGREEASASEPVGLDTPAFLRGPDDLCGEVAS